MISWLFLSCAIVFEIIATTCLKLSDGLRNIQPTIIMFVSYIICFLFLVFAVRKIEISVAYAIWSGVGVAAMALIGPVLFQEQMTASKIIFMALIIIGVVGLKLTSGQS